MRHGALVTLTLGALVLAAPAARAEPREAYVTMVLQAFAAKVDCPDTDVVYQDLVKKAQEMQQPDGTTETVRKAIAFLLTRRFSAMLLVAIAVAITSSLAGIWLSFLIDSAPAPTIVMFMSLAFIATFIRTTLKARRIDAAGETGF